MKKCSKCGRTYSDLISTCPSCGNVLGGTSVDPTPIKPPPIPAEPPFQPSKPTPAPIPVDNTDTMGKGVLGACLFGFGGAVLQAVLLNISTWGTFSGIAIFYLTLLGFAKYSNSGSCHSKKELMICGFVTIAMIAIGTVLGYTYFVSKQLDIGFYDALVIIQQIKEIQSAVAEDIGRTIVRGTLLCIITMFLSRNKK